MSVEICCPSCYSVISRTAYGRESGEYSCPDCGDFRVEMGDKGMETYEI